MNREGERSRVQEALLQVRHLLEAEKAHDLGRDPHVARLQAAYDRLAAVIAAADRRDKAAEARDRAAELRDAAAAAREADGAFAEVEAAADRAASSVDRLWAGYDRDAAAADRDNILEEFRSNHRDQ